MDSSDHSNATIPNQPPPANQQRLNYDPFFVTSVVNKSRQTIEALESQWNDSKSCALSALKRDDDNKNAETSRPPANDSVSVMPFDEAWSYMEKFQNIALGNNFTRGLESYAGFEAVTESEEADYLNQINMLYAFDKVRVYSSHVSSYLRMKMAGTRKAFKAYGGNSRVPSQIYFGEHDGTDHNIHSQLINEAAQSENIGFAKLNSPPHVGVVFLGFTNPPILQIAMLFRGFVVENVNVKGFDENFGVIQRGETIDFEQMWAPSKHLVFREISVQAKAAVLRFFYPMNPKAAMKHFFHWLESYSSMWSVPCRSCGKILMDGVPPTHRDFRSREPYHKSCRAS